LRPTYRDSPICVANLARAYDSDLRSSPRREGYRDGITDGLQQRGRLGSFRANATEKYQKADHGYSYSNGDPNEYKQAYREAYCNGYQQAYYRETENIEAAIFSEANASE
jgi:hypothetical protein